VTKNIITHSLESDAVKESQRYYLVIVIM